MKYVILSFFILLFIGLISYEVLLSTDHLLDQPTEKIIQFPQIDSQPLWGNCQSGNLKNKYVIHLWATWCPTCQNDMPQLIEIIKSRSDIFFYIVSINSELSQVKTTIKKLKITSNNLCFMEGNMAFAHQLGTSNFPESHIFDKFKNYQYKLIGNDIISEKMIKALTDK